MTYLPSKQNPVKNYFGTGADGAVTYSTTTNLTSTTDGAPIIKNFTDLTINSGVTLSVSNRCRGLIIYCSGNCVINGTISMDSKGANIAGVNKYFMRKTVTALTQDPDISALETIGAILRFDVPLPFFS